MTNAEYWKNDILRITGETHYRFAVIDGKPEVCTGSCCNRCDFDGACNANLFKWLYQEHIENPKLTKKERYFCEILESGYIARNKDGSLAFFQDYPVRHTAQWINQFYRTPATLSFTTLALGIMHIDRAFAFITWDDKSPWSIEDLLKLEVEW